MFASRVKAALFLARFEHHFYGWHVQYQLVDDPGYTELYTLKIRDLVEQYKRKLPLRDTNTQQDFETYSVKDDPLLDAARKLSH